MDLAWNLQHFFIDESIQWLSFHCYRCHLVAFTVESRNSTPKQLLEHPDNSNIVPFPLKVQNIGIPLHLCISVLEWYLYGSKKFLRAFPSLYRESSPTKSLPRTTTATQFLKTAPQEASTAISLFIHYPLKICFPAPVYTCTFWVLASRKIIHNQ